MRNKTNTSKDRSFLKGAVLVGAAFVLLLAALMAWGDRTSEAPSPTGPTTGAGSSAAPSAPTETRPSPSPTAPTVPVGPN
jgi:cytoskeletal protein RodZ